MIEILLTANLLVLLHIAYHTKRTSGKANWILRHIEERLQIGDFQRDF